MKKNILIALLIAPVCCLGQRLLAPSAGGTKPGWKSTPPSGLLGRVSVPPAFNPGTVPGIITWFDATSVTNTVSGGTMHILKDLSGNGHDMTASQAFPTYVTSGGANNKPYIQMQNGTDLETGVLTLTNPYTVYYVMRQDTFETTPAFVMSFDNGNGTFMQQTTLPAGNTITMHAGSTGNRWANPGRQSTWQVLSLNVNNTNPKFGVNNEPFRQEGFMQVPSSPGNSNGNWVGLAPYYKNSKYSVEEILVYSGTPSAANDSLIRNYLTAKYTPPKNKVLVVIGDSIAAGTNASNLDSNSWAALTVRDSFPIYNIANWGYGGTVWVSRPGAVGVSGSNGTDMVPRLLAEGVDWTNVRIAFEWGTNDVATDATWVTAATANVNSFLALGIPTNHIILCTMPARATGGTASLSATYLTTYNNLKSVATATGVLFYDNITYETSSWVSGNMAVDGIHLSDLGSIAYHNGFETILQ